MHNTSDDLDIHVAVDAVKALTKLRRRKNAAISNATLKSIENLEAELSREIDVFFGFVGDRACAKTVRRESEM